MRLSEEKKIAAETVPDGAPVQGDLGAILYTGVSCLCHLLRSGPCSVNIASTSMSCAQSGSERSSFPAFPYEPYSIQQDFMQALYGLLQRGGVGLFESPTGKS